MKRTDTKRIFSKSNIILTHIQNNMREYIIASVIFVLGIMLGIYFINNLDVSNTVQITNYINKSINSIKSGNTVNKLDILKQSIKTDFIIVISLWLMGSTVIGLLLVYIILCFKGFSLGYTISTIIYVLGRGKGTLFIVSSMILKNIIVIPCVIALAVSGMKLYKSIIQDRRRENIKVEVIRHTIFSTFILVLLIAASFIETYVSNSILLYFIKYI